MLNSFLKKYLFTLIPFLILDGLWLGLVAPSFYKANIGHLMTASPNFAAAGLFYLLYVAGLVMFVTGRAGTLKQAALRGAFFGLLCYATYDLTNLATLQGWPVIVTVVDLVWGTFATTVTSVAAVWLIQKFAPANHKPHRR